MNVLGKLLGVRPNEWSRFLVFFLINLLLAIGINIGSTASLSMFIRRYGVQFLPLMFIFTSILTVAVMTVYTNYLGRAANEHYYLALLALSAATVAFNWILIRLEVRAVYLLLYPAYSIITAVSYSHLFVIVYEYFDTMESKRLFPLVSSGISLGGILGGFAIKGLLRYMDTQDLLLVWIVFIGLAGAGTLSIRLFHLEPAEKKPEPRKKSSVGFFSGLSLNYRAVMQIPLVRTMIYATVTITAAFFILDFLSSQVFARVFPNEEDLTGFLGMFTAASSLIGLLVQMAVLPRVLASIGVANANFIYPGITLASMAALLAWPALPSACLGYFNRKFVAYAVGEPVDRLLYNSLPAQMKGRTSAFIKGYVVPLSAVAASLCIMAVNAVFNSNESAAFFTLAAFGLAVSAAHLGQKALIKRGYVQSLIGLIKDRNVDLDSLADDWSIGDESKLEKIPLDEYLESDDESLYALTLEIIRTAGTRRCTQKLKKIFPRLGFEMKLQTLRTIASVEGSNEASFFFEVLESKEEPLVRAEAIGILSELKDEETVERLVECLADVDDQVQDAAIVAVCACGDIFKMSLGFSMLNNLLISDDDGEFSRGIDVLVSIGDRRFIRTLFSFLDKHRDEKRWKIVGAMASLESGEDERNLERFHRLFEAESGKTLGHVIDAIKKIRSPRSIPLLESRLTELSLSNRLKAVECLGAMGGQATDGLIGALNEAKQSPEVRIACLDQLAKNDTNPAHWGLNKILAHEIRDIYALIQLREKLTAAKNCAELLNLLVNEILEQRVRIWLHTVARTARRPGEVAMLIDTILSGSKAARAGAVETLENLLDKRHCALILPVFDNVSDNEKISAVAQKLQLRDASLLDLFVSTKNSVNSWHAACFIYSIDAIAGEAGPERLAQILEEALNGGDADMAEAVRLSAARLGLTSRVRSNPCPAGDGGFGAGPARSAAPQEISGGPPMLSVFEKILFLKKAPTFAGLDSHGLKVLSGISQEISFAVGEIIFEEGDQGDAMYVIQKGRVRLYKGKDRNAVLVVLEEASYFGEMAVLDNDPRSASAAAETDCTLIRIQRDHFIKLIHDYPNITIPIFQVLSRRLRDAQK